jgi:hypothetical protein
MTPLERSDLTYLIGASLVVFTLSVVIIFVV